MREARVGGSPGRGRPGIGSGIVLCVLETRMFPLRGVAIRPAWINSRLIRTGVRRLVLLQARRADRGSDCPARRVTTRCPFGALLGEVPISSRNDLPVADALLSRWAAAIPAGSHPGGVEPVPPEREWLPGCRSAARTSPAPAGWAQAACLTKRRVVERCFGSAPRARGAKRGTHQRGCPFVGLTGFEPATLRSQSGCATKLRHSPGYFAQSLAPPATVAHAALDSAAHAGVAQW